MKRDTDVRPPGDQKQSASRLPDRVSWALIICGLLVTVTPLAWQQYTNLVNEQTEDTLQTWNDQPSSAFVERKPRAESLLLEIPRLRLRRQVPNGADQQTLRRFGVGRISWTSWPGTEGTAGIAGHRTTYGAPFFYLNRLRPGDLIHVSTRSERYTYAVTGLVRVRPSRSDVLGAQPGTHRLALVTCEPRYSARYRLVVFAVRIAEHHQGGGE